MAINILGFNLFDGSKYPDMHSCFGIYDMKTGCQLTDKLEIHFLELLKFKSKNVKEMNRMEKWAAYFSPSTPDEELAEIAASEAAIQEAMEVEDVFTKDEVAKRSYEKAEKFRRDQAAQLSYARGEGQLSERLANIKSIMNNLHLSAEKAMEALGIPAVDFQKYRGQL